LIQFTIKKEERGERAKKKEKEKYNEEILKL